MRQGKTIGIALAAVVAAGTLSAPAQASVYTIDWTGTIDGNTHLAGVYNVDDTGIFGMGTGFALTGQAITVSVKVDTATPGAYYDNVGYSALIGHGSGTPVGVSIKINGVTFALNQDHIGGAHLVPMQTWSESQGLVTVGDTYDGYPAVAEGVAAEDATGVRQSYYRSAHSNFITGDSVYRVSDYVLNQFDLAGFSLPMGIVDDNVETPPPSRTWTFDLSTQLSGYFVIHEDHEGYNARDDSYDDYRVRNIASASFVATSVTVTSDNRGGPTDGAVPEPASWILMIAGLGLAGAMLRGCGRQRRRMSLRFA